MHIENMDIAEIFSYLVKNCNRKAVLKLCEEHMYEEETDEELAEFVEDIRSARPGIDSLAYESMGGEEDE